MSATQTDFLDSLNQRFGIDDQLRFQLHSSGLIECFIQTEYCEGAFFLLGSHVSHFKPTDAARPFLFMSQASYYEVGKPVRGGIPICFPWFGQNKSDATAPSHGFARTQLWDVIHTSRMSDHLKVVLTLKVDPWSLRYEMKFGSSLDVALTATNDSQIKQAFEVALHSYFLISSIESTRIEGLELTPYRDQLTSKNHDASGVPIHFETETDRVYQGSVRRIQIHDMGFSRSINIEPKHSESTGVWNPWIDKSKRMPDFGDDEYHHMCCVETANVGPVHVDLSPGESHTTSVRIGLSPMGYRKERA